jgi:hypothetical protein
MSRAASSPLMRSTSRSSPSAWACVSNAPPTRIARRVVPDLVVCPHGLYPLSQITRKLAVLYDNPHFAGLALRPHEIEANQVQGIPAQWANSLVAVNG